MQIQRLQTLWLLIAVACATASLFATWWTADALKVTPLDNPMLMIISCLSAVLSLVGLFMFKNLRRQKLVSLLAALMALLAVGYGVAMTYLPGRENIGEHLGALWMVGAAFADLMARRCIISDDKLLRSADRLR